MQGDPPGRAPLQRIIQLTIGLTKPYHHVTLNADFHADIEMWKTFLVSWNGKAFFLNNFWETSDQLHLFADASGSLGFAGIYGQQWFQGVWQPDQTLTSRGYQLHGRSSMQSLLQVQYGANNWSANGLYFTVTTFLWCLL